MKLRVLISLLFIISTTFAAVHEVEHLGHDHDSSKCLECTVSHNFLSADINKPDVSIELVHLKQNTIEPIVFSISFKKRDNHSNAPPSLS